MKMLHGVVWILACMQIGDEEVEVLKGGKRVFATSPQLDIISDMYHPARHIDTIPPHGSTTPRKSPNRFISPRLASPHPPLFPQLHKKISTIQHSIAPMVHPRLA